MTIVVMRADQVLEMFEDLRERLAVAHDHVGEEDPGENPVAFGNMPAKTESTALLPTEDGVGLRHLGPDEFEPNHQLVHGDAKPGTELIAHRGGGPRAAHVALAPALFAPVRLQTRS